MQTSRIFLLPEWNKSEKDRKITDAGSTEPKVGHHPCESRVSSMQVYGCGGTFFLFDEKVGKARQQTSRGMSVINRQYQPRKKRFLNALNSSVQKITTPTQCFYQNIAYQHDYPIPTTKRRRSGFSVLYMDKEKKEKHDRSKHKTHIPF